MVTRIVGDMVSMEGGYGAHMEGGTVSNEGDMYPMKEYSRG